MPGRRFTDEQIAFALRQADGGTPVGEICRRMGVSEATFYRWKKVYAGMGVAGVRRRTAARGRERQAQTARRGPQLGQGDAAGRAEKKVVRPVRRREVVRHFEAACAVSERRAWPGRAAPARASHRYAPRRDPQEPLRGRPKELAATRVRYGHRRLHVLLRREGWKANHKRVYRLYSEEGLSIRTRTPRRRRSCRYRSGRAEAGGANDVWAMDFVSDRLFDERPFRILTIVDCFTREALSTAPRTNYRA